MSVIDRCYFKADHIVSLLSQLSLRSHIRMMRAMNHKSKIGVWECVICGYGNTKLAPNGLDKIVGYTPKGRQTVDVSAYKAMAIINWFM